MGKKITTTFEGWYDENPEWEFDMPVYMVNPVGGYIEAGNSGGVENLIEDYQIAISNGDKPDDYFENCEAKEKKYIKSMCTRAKNKKAREGITYWKQVIEWDTETFKSKIIEDIIICKDS